MEALNVGESTSLGTGMMISTLFAIDRDLNWLFACSEQSSDTCRNKCAVDFSLFCITNFTF